MIRKIINIDQDKCNGCGDCVPNCAEGAIQIIDGKARLISDLFCDGLGACIGYCPLGAITIEEREATPYNEYLVMENIMRGGDNVILAHLDHLHGHGEITYLNEAKKILEDKKHNSVLSKFEENILAKKQDARKLKQINVLDDESNVTNKSYLSHWPIQLHLISPYAEHFHNSDLVLAADCVGFAYPNFHSDFLKNKTVAIACPKLDSNKEVYLKKLIALINETKIKSLTVLIMQVPCCGGLFQLAKSALKSSEHKIPLRLKIIGINGEVLNEVNF